MKITDSHAHIFPAKIAEKATISIGQFYDLSMNGVGSAENLIKSGDEIGVSKYLVCSTATRPEQVHAINDFIHAEQSARPGVFYGFGTVHVGLDDIEAEVERIKVLGLYGIKLHPDFQQTNIDEGKMLPAYRLAAEYKLPILFHMGDPRYDYSAAWRLANLLEKVPTLTVIAAHLGGFMAWDEAMKYLPTGSVWTDTCSSMSMMSPDQAKILIEHFGFDRVMFASDFPMWKHQRQRDVFDSLGYSDEIRQAIYNDNFCHLLKIKD